MGANVNDKTVTKAGKCVAVVQRVCQAFEEQTSSTSRSDNHPYPKFGKDFDMVLNVLEQEESLRIQQTEFLQSDWRCQFLTSEPRKVTLNARPSPWHMSDHVQGSGLGPD